MKQIQPLNVIFRYKNFNLKNLKIRKERSGIINKKYLGWKLPHVIFLILISLGCSFHGHSQSFPRYPIPSYNVPVDGFANFSNQSSVSQKSSLNEKRSITSPENKRDIIIRISSATTPGQSCKATVWVYSLDLTTVLGPYYLSCGNEISVEIDDRQWGVMVDSQDKVVMDVWMDDGGEK
jgi:hypothetical protein